MRSKKPEAPVEPWYRQGWPWFLIALPATAVVAGRSLACPENRCRSPTVVLSRPRNSPSAACAVVCALARPSEDVA